eukprot:6271941-Prymnesium_polylepis.1
MSAGPSRTSGRARESSDSDERLCGLGAAADVCARALCRAAARAGARSFLHSPTAQRDMPPSGTYAYSSLQSRPSDGKGRR